MICFESFLHVYSPLSESIVSVGFVNVLASAPSWDAFWIFLFLSPPPPPPSPLPASQWPSKVLQGWYVYALGLNHCLFSHFPVRTSRLGKRGYGRFPSNCYGSVGIWTWISHWNLNSIPHISLRPQDYFVLPENWVFITPKVLSEMFYQSLPSSWKGAGPVGARTFRTPLDITYDVSCLSVLRT